MLIFCSGNKDVHLTGKSKGHILLYSSLCCVAGLGDMAVSNTIGSNVFDILVGLGVPWAIQTMCVSYGSEVRG